LLSESLAGLVTDAHVKFKEMKKISAQ